MSLGPVSPVLGRISEIEARFGDRGAPATEAVGDAADDFDAVLSAAGDAAAASTPMERVAATLEGSATNAAHLGGALAPFADLLPAPAPGHVQAPAGTPVPTTAPPGLAALQPAVATWVGFPATTTTAPSVSVGDGHVVVRAHTDHGHGAGSVGGSTAVPGSMPYVDHASVADTAVPASVPYADLFTDAGTRHGVPPRLLAAVGHVESRYQPDVVSDAGAMGLMQLMPFVAEELGVDAFDPPAAVDGAARLLAGHHQRFGSWELALAAYFSGPGAVSRAGDTVPTTRSQHYVENVLDRMEHM